MPWGKEKVNTMIIPKHILEKAKKEGRLSDTDNNKSKEKERIGLISKNKSGNHALRYSIKNKEEHKNNLNVIVLPKDANYICSWFLPGKPVPKGRPRLIVDRKKLLLAIKARSIEMALSAFVVKTPQRTLDYENRVRDASHKVITDTGLTRLEDKEVYVETVFYTRTPSRADIDNLVKAILDGMNTYIYKDDKQVSHIKAHKKCERNFPLEGVLVTVRIQEPEAFDSSYNQVLAQLPCEGLH